MAHIHIVDDYDKRFIIDPITRKMTNQTPEKNTLVQNDHNSERFTFELPRIIEGHDMCTCNSVQVHYINIDSVTKAQSAGVYQVDDLRVDPENDNVVVCSWLVSQNATKHKGLLSFVIRFVCTIDGNIDYAWNTAVCSDIVVSDGIYNSNVVIEEYNDVLAGFEVRLAALEQKGDGGGESDPTVFDWAKKELFNKANFVDPANRNTFVTIDGVEYYRYHCSAQNFEYHNPKPFPGSVTITIRTMSQYTNGVSGIVLHYADGTSEVIYPERGVVTIYTTDASKTFVKMSGRYDMENWNLIDMSVMSIQANYNIGIPVANANAPGGIKAEPATEADTQPVRIGENGMLYTAPGGIPGAGNARETSVLAEFTLTEDVDGTIRIPLSANPFEHSALLIEISSQLMTGGTTQYIGHLYGGGKHSNVFHLNTIFDVSSVRTVYIMADLFYDSVHSIAAKKVDYMWNTTNHYTYVYPIETDTNAYENVLEISVCSAVSGATVKVQGVK